MEMQYFKEYSPELGRDMECKLYGHAGRPMQIGRASCRERVYVLV